MAEKKRYRPVIPNVDTPERDALVQKYSRGLSFFYSSDKDSDNPKLKTPIFKYRNLEEFCKITYFSPNSDKDSEPENKEFIKPRKEYSSLIPNSLDSVVFQEEFFKKDDSNQSQEIISSLSTKDLSSSIIFPNKKTNYGLYSSLGGIGLSLGVGVSVNAENIAQFVAPIVEYVRAMRPDYIVACDRGARLIGMGVLMLYRELYGKLPTTDGTVRFRRISKSDARSDTKQHLEPLVKEMTSARANPRVLVLDDWIASGSTKQLVESLFEELAPGRVDLRYGVLLWGNADVSGDGNKTSSFAGSVDWHDNTSMIGVAYTGTKPRTVKSLEARNYRETMLRSIHEYAEQVRQNAASIKQPTKPKKPHSFLASLANQDNLQFAQAV